jgi:hypothetical protein
LARLTHPKLDVVGKQIFSGTGNSHYGNPGAFNTNSNGDKIIFYNDGTSYDGRIGVGSTSNLWLKSYGETANEGDIEFYAGGGNRVTIKGSGNVGIGTTSPSAKLHIASTVAKIAEFERTGSANYDLTISDLGAGAAQLWFNANTNNTGFLFRPKNSSGTNVNALMVDPDGNVGIGTTSPVMLNLM